MMLLTMNVELDIFQKANVYMFQLTDSEVDYMVSQNAIPSKQNLDRTIPNVFMELV